MMDFFREAGRHWSEAFSEKHFRLYFPGGLLTLAGLAALLPPFYRHIENRQGILMHDWLLLHLPSMDVSIPIFTIVWGLMIFTFFRAMCCPEVLLNFLYGYIFFVVLRCICLLLVPLEPPQGIIGLVDPLTNIFYGGTFMSKDLFFSGHTCTVVLLFLSVKSNVDKTIYAIATVMLGALLLIQHVHYTIDVVAAPLFGLAAFGIGQMVLKKSRSFANY